MAYTLSLSYLTFNDLGASVFHFPLPLPPLVWSFLSLDFDATTSLLVVVLFYLLRSGMSHHTIFGQAISVEHIGIFRNTSRRLKKKGCKQTH